MKYWMIWKNQLPILTNKYSMCIHLIKLVDKKRGIHQQAYICLSIYYNLMIN